MKETIYFTIISILIEYFALSGESLAAFRRSLHRLSAEERQELAQGAARAMGLDAGSVEFPLE